MKLHQLAKAQGANRVKKRKGKGPGSGNGKTAGRGHKGAKSRSGYAMPNNYSGIPWYRRLPRRGFSNFRFTKRYDLVNVADLENLHGVDSIDREVLIQAGLIRATSVRIKVLGNGEITKPLNIKADKVSASAKAKIEACGGKVEELEPTEVSQES